MLRMAHRIASRGAMKPPGMENSHAIALLDDILLSHVFIIDSCLPAANYLSEKATFKECLKQLGSLKLPYTRCFFEMSIQSLVDSEHDESPRSRHDDLQIGILVTESPVSLIHDAYLSRFPNFPELCTQVLMCTVIVTMHDGVVILTNNVICVATDASGKYIDSYILVNDPSRETDESLEQICGHMRASVFRALFAVALCNAKNVKQVDRTAEFGPPEKWLRRMKQPKITYKVLEITGTKGQSQGSSHRMTPAEQQNAWHLVRGNFATYTPEKPLFGSLTGTFWRPSHVRGKADNGVVLKDYKIDA